MPDVSNIAKSIQDIMRKDAVAASKYTRVRVPGDLVFVEHCADRSAASKREMEIKSLKRAEKLALMASF